MHLIDLSVFVIYMFLVLGIGFYFLKRNKDADDYYVGSRKMGSMHIGLSVVATDVGGGFSIGLGGLGFMIGMAGSWMLFTGLIGAWISAVVLIPRVHPLGKDLKLFTFPELFRHFYNPRVAMAAGIISGIGYLGFTSSQILAGAKLASATFVDLDMNSALIIMGLIAIIYTVMGGIKAVIYTDTFQWIILMGGLVLIGIPAGCTAIGGLEAVRETLGPEYLSFRNVAWQTIINWAVTIIPIWFVGMTLYQRIYATRSVKQAQRAWYIAGIFEWPFMAMMGVILGLFSRVAFENGMFEYLGYAPGTGLDPEQGLPLLLRTILPVGLMGLMMSAYFSAIMSTADSCMMAASGNLLTDVLSRLFKIHGNQKVMLRFSQGLTLFIGIVALMIAATMENVLELMLYSYAFMVSGLLMPVIGAFFLKKKTPQAAFWSMLIGGGTTLFLTVSGISLPLGLDPNIFGISASAIVFFSLVFLFPHQGKNSEPDLR
jgi:solute:Na+ symporter, SSS family